jgi:hypothetical protein
VDVSRHDAVDPDRPVKIQRAFELESPGKKREHLIIDWPRTGGQLTPRIRGVVLCTAVGRL